MTCAALLPNLRKRNQRMYYYQVMARYYRDFPLAILNIFPMIIALMSNLQTTAIFACIASHWVRRTFLPSHVLLEATSSCVAHAPSARIGSLGVISCWYRHVVGNSSRVPSSASCSCCSSKAPTGCSGWTSKAAPFTLCTYSMYGNSHSSPSPSPSCTDDDVNRTHSL